MAKKSDKDKAGASASSRADAVRSAVDQAFQATSAQGAAAAEQGRERAQDIIDQFAQAAGRFRDVLDELRPPTGEDVKSLRQTIAELEQRIAALEAAQGARPAPARRGSTAKKPAAAKSGSAGSSRAKKTPGT